MTTAVTTPRPAAIDDYARVLRERVRRFADEADPYLRGLIATRVYRDQPDLPVVRKRAEIQALALEGLEPIVLPEERIVGAVYRRRRVHEGVSYPDAWRSAVFYPEANDLCDDWPIPDEVRRELAWWDGRRRRVCGANEVRSRNAWLWRYAIAAPHGAVNGHTLPDHGIVLRAGIAELRDRIARRLAAADEPARRSQYLAMDRSLQGLSTHCRRFAAAARDQARRVGDPVLRRRLAAAAANCDRVATDPPEGFAQALQLLYFSNFADLIDTPGDAASYGRIDQLLLPYYQADLRRGSLGRSDAFDLVCCFLIKAWVALTSANMTVGGVGPDGRDATNDLSYIFLEAMEATEMPTDITARLHAGSPDDFVRTAARVVRRGLGRPSLYNDDVVVEALVRKGVAGTDARDYAPLGCVEVMIPGRSAYRTMCMGLNLVKVLELVLNGGCCLVTGEGVFDAVPQRFDSFDDLLDEYHRRVRGVVDVAVEIIRADERLEHTVTPRPYLTVLSRGGIESGVDMTAGQPKYDPVGVTLDGLADVVNSLYAVKVLVYERKRLTLDELRRILRADWEGSAPLRRYVINRLPRFGQDDARINEIARAVAAHYAACFAGRRTLYGGPFCPMIFGVSTSLIHHHAPNTGATPSGRRRGEGLAMSLQPSSAGPRGPTTAVLRSAAAVDFRDFAGGVSNVQECDPSLVAGPDGLDRLVNLIRGFFSLGGMELSLNFLSVDKLREAQAHPDRHRHLMVRLFGLSAQFVNLSRRVQESVIERVAAASRRPDAAAEDR